MRLDEKMTFDSENVTQEAATVTGGHEDSVVVIKDSVFSTSEAATG